jgi:hypothetical protein
MYIIIDCSFTTYSYDFKLTLSHRHNTRSTLIRFADLAPAYKRERVTYEDEEALAIAMNQLAPSARRQK